MIGKKGKERKQAREKGLEGVDNSVNSEILGHLVNVCVYVSRRGETKDVCNKEGEISCRKKGKSRSEKAKAFRLKKWMDTVYRGDGEAW